MTREGTVDRASLDVVVIGAGPACVSAALQLVQAGACTVRSRRPFRADAAG
jgi:pyruvate/2-oxoglutarate dehydrogenase complex dihydrolipoamide dehydrogenase (E3) component